MSIQRRLELVNYAHDSNCYIVEDDYDSEFNYNNRFIPTIKELDIRNDTVIYAGTFSKVLYPSLRIGYLLLPDKLTRQFKEVKSLGDHYTNAVNQLMVNTFVEEGYLSRHIMKMKKVYKHKRDYLINVLNTAFGNKIEILGSNSGMHLIVRFNSINFSEKLIQEIHDKGVLLPPPIEDVALIKGLHIGEIALGYTNLSPSQLSEGVEIIKEVISSHI